MLDEEGQRWASWGESETGHGRGQTIASGKTVYAIDAID